MHAVAKYPCFAFHLFASVFYSRSIVTHVRKRNSNQSNVRIFSTIDENDLVTVGERVCDPIERFGAGQAELPGRAPLPFRNISACANHLLHFPHFCVYFTHRNYFKFVFLGRAGAQRSNGVQMSKLSRKELDARIQELLRRSDELFHAVRYQGGAIDFDNDENIYVLKETEKLIAELRRQRRELGDSPDGPERKG
jgi:hypothetical protein